MEEKFVVGRFWRNKTGFTLIELLVVVLIIGILAAIALPQYQMSVWKSRYVQAKTLATTLAEAMEIAYLTDGRYPVRLQDLDVSLEFTKTNKGLNQECAESEDVCYYLTSWGNCELQAKGIASCFVYKNGKNFLRYAIFLNHYNGKNRKKWDTYCIAMNQALGRVPTADDISYKVCVAETGNTTPADAWTTDRSFLYKR